jgi:DNA-binding Xre family transcriptional regulator
VNEYKEIVSRQIRDYGRIEVKLKDQLDRRQMTRNRLRTLTGVKYDVIDRYYKGVDIQMVDLDFLAKVCCVFDCQIGDLLEYHPPAE